MSNSLSGGCAQSSNLPAWESQPPKAHSWTCGFPMSLCEDVCFPRHMVQVMPQEHETACSETALNSCVYTSIRQWRMYPIMCTHHTHRVLKNDCNLLQLSAKDLGDDMLKDPEVHHRWTLARTLLGTDGNYSLEKNLICLRISGIGVSTVLDCIVVMVGIY